MKKIIQLLMISILLLPCVVYADNTENIETTNNEEITENAETNTENTENTESTEDPVITPRPVLKYKAHVQNIGWQDYVNENMFAGTDHRSLRLESFIIDLGENNNLIEYRSLVEGTGWETSYKKGGEISGTTKQSKKIEAIQVRLLGELAEEYDIYYRVHCENFGWMPWAKNDEISGTIGYGKRVESFIIKLERKGQGVETENTYKERGTALLYKAHIQDFGWTDERSENIIGTFEDKRLESFYIKLDYQQYSGSIHYSSYVEGIGWQEEKTDGEISGTSKQSKRIEAIKIRLSGALTVHYDIYYRVYTNVWSGWAKNNEIAGSLGYDKKITAIEVKLVPVGTGEETGNSYTRKPIILKYAGYVQNIGQQDFVNERELAGTTGKKLRVEGITIDLDTIYNGTIEYTTRTDQQEWQEYKTSGNYSGTKHQSKAIQNIRMRLTGDLAEDYDIYYRVHTASYGWLGWAKNDEIAGVNHYQIEALEIRIYAKDDEEKDELPVSGHYIAQVFYKPVYYSQKDSRWVNQKLGLSTIGRSGCAPTSMAMAFQGILNEQIYPTDVARYLYDYTWEYNRRDKGASGKAIVKAAEYYGVKRTALTTKEELIEALQEGKIVFAAMGNGHFGKLTYNHAIILYGFQNNQTNVYDPLPDNNNNHLFPIDLLWEEQSKDPDDYSGGSNFHSLERY